MKHILIEDPAKRFQNKRRKKAKANKWLRRVENKVFKMQDFLRLCSQDEVLRDLAIDENSLEFLSSVGMGLRIKDEKIFLKTYSTHYKDQVFCFVDIETTGTSPFKNNLLELGAILCNGRGEVLNHFESYVKNEEIPEVIGEITGITKNDVCDAPDVVEVLQEFRKFLGESVFVAHNVEFDYSFLNDLYLKYFGIGLYNQQLCTLKMAQKTLTAQRYGLAFLNEALGICMPVCHRAYADAFVCKEIFMQCIKNLPLGINSAQSLINFVNKKE